MKKEFFDKLYEKVIPFAIKDMEEKYAEEVKSTYRHRLVEKYGNFRIEESNFEKVLETVSRYEISLLSLMPTSSRLTELVRDVHFEKIAFVSNIGYKNALKRYKENKIMNELEAKSYIKIMQERVDKVFPFNTDLAEEYLSEGTVDFYYASGMTDNMSLRMGRKIR